MITRSKRAQYVLLLTLTTILVVGIVCLQQITDWVRLHGYTPSTRVSQLVTETTMNDAARHLFYINRPEIVSKDNFSTKCTTEKEQTIVLGCYHGVQNGIYVLNITNDERLNGVMQVTAAHEMLHAAYDRLSKEKRVEVDSMLRAYYNDNLSDERIRQTIAGYEDSNSADLTNEMHSIFGTEVENLPPKLSEYYDSYFKDRSKVTSFAADYQSEFTSRSDAVERLDAQLKDLKQTITENETDLDTRSAALKSQAMDLERQRDSGNANMFNTNVDRYNASVADYNTKIAATKELIGRYNAVVQDRNKIALESEQLNEELSGDNLNTVQGN